MKMTLIDRNGAIILSEQPLPKPSPEAANDAFLSHIEAEGFAPTGLEDAVRTMCARTGKLCELFGEAWPDWSPDQLAETVRDWLSPLLSSQSFTMPTPAKLGDALKARLEWPLPQELDQRAPLSTELPSGRTAKIDWLDERAPLIECKAQELYGASAHITLAGGRLPVTLQILSPGGKPVATTQDLPGFWQGGYGDMAKDMRGRYPKHDWPDDPASAKPHAGMTKARLAKS